MAKPRIIIADTDYSYIIPLQLKFSEEFFDKIDIEIITEQSYLDVFLATPQKANILIIAENLYVSSIQRHNISNVFIMTEQHEDEQTGELSTSKLFKYTSIKEIFSEITGKSAEALKVGSAKKKKSQIITVCSPCGGSGKTTVAMGISACLSKSYKKVLYINADRLQTFQRLLANSSPISASELYSSLVNPRENIFNELQHVIRKESFSYLPPFKAAIISLGLEFGVYEQIAESAKRENIYDYILIDLNTGFDEDMAQLLRKSDRVIVVTNQTSAAVYATNIFVSNVNGINSEKYIFICNNCNESSDITDARVHTKYIVNEYIQHFPDYDGMSCDDFSRNSGMQKAAFLIV